MKGIKFSLVLLFISFISATILQAQPNRGQRGASSLEKLKKEITLTEEQEAEIKTIIDKYRSDMKDLREQSIDDPTARREVFKALAKAQQEAIEAILTDEQKATLAANKATRQQEMEARRDEMMALREQYKAFQEALKKYHEEEVLPVLLAQRAKLEQQISAEDKATIDELRAKMKDKRETFQDREIEKKPRKRGAESRSKRPDRQRGKATGKRSERRAQVDDGRKKLHDLIKTYKENIDALHEEISAQREQWKTDIENLREQHITIEPDRGNRSRGRRMHQGPPNRSRDGQRGERKERINYGHFLLLNPDDTENAAQILQETPEIKLNVFPNPTANTNTLQYKLEQAGQIRISLHDEKGNLVKTIFNGHQEAGDYSQVIDVNDLNSGVYYYTIKSPLGVSSMKMVISQ